MALARARDDVELVSVDSMQVYRGMDVGTAKPTPAEQAEVRHHVIDLVDPWEPYEVHSFQAAVRDALADIAGRGRRAVLVGGTGLYLQAVVDGFEIPGRFPAARDELEADPDTEGLHARLAALDPAAADRMEPTNRRRVVRALEVTVGSGRPFSSYGPGAHAHPATPVHLVGLRLDPDRNAARIEARFHQQLADGFWDEVDRLAAGPALSRTAAQALGYRELLAQRAAAAAGDEHPSEQQAVAEAIARTRAFARRQRAWFRRDPRIEWLDVDPDGDALDHLDHLLALAAPRWDR
ncbi:MAG: tRNA (adenosine(37)-N6)-dimethylallyltransferase MiaA [Acidimicrobiales bacterium]|nr:tRNA (adenosine(37)-N6)-dimethylallyltransferase MiaA [Acidimicrobiales bacterium]